MEVAATAKPARNAIIDGLKYVAAATIVLHHVGPGGGGIGAALSSASVWALFFFFVAAGYFHGPQGDRGLPWLGKRVKRLLVPYAIWSVAFVLKDMVLVGLRYDIWRIPPLKGAVDLVFFAGVHGILWTLPMLIYLAIAAEFLARTPVARRVMIGVALAVTLGMYFSSHLEAIVTHPLANFLLAPRWFLAYLGGMEIRASKPMTPTRLALWVAPLAFLAAGATRVFSSSYDTGVLYVLQTVLWLGLSFLALAGAHSGLGWYGVRKLAWGRDYLMGVYITHVVWLSYIAPLVPPDWPGIAWVAAVWALVLAGSSLTVWLLRTNRVTRVAVV